MKTFTDDKINATQKLTFELGGLGNNMRTGENAGLEQNLLFLQCSQELSFSGLFNYLPHKPDFKRPRERSPLKT